MNHLKALYVKYTKHLACSNSPANYLKDRQRIKFTIINFGNWNPHADHIKTCVARLDSHTALHKSLNVRKSESILKNAGNCSWSLLNHEQSGLSLALRGHWNLFVTGIWLCVSFLSLFYPKPSRPWPSMSFLKWFFFFNMNIYIYLSHLFLITFQIL